MNAYDLFAGDVLLFTFLLVTVAMGGSAAYQAGKAIAQTWRPYWHVPAYGLILAQGNCVGARGQYDPPLRLRRDRRHRRSNHSRSSRKSK